MENAADLTGYDFVVLGIFVLFLVRGIWFGFLRQICGFVALLVAYVVASSHHEKIFPFLNSVSDNPKVIFITSCVILFIVTYVLVMFLGKGLAKVVDMSFVKWFDKLLGVFLGGVLASVVIIFMHMIVGSLLPSDSTMLKECETCTVLNPATDYVRALIKDEEVRKTLMQQTQAITAEDVTEFLKKNGEAVKETVDKIMDNPGQEPAAEK
ncbi:MAG: colicin V production protein [Desulfobacterales bacterium]|nr:MAG: colicin V production protein [Desulfobacterales bacterium]